MSNPINSAEFIKSSSALSQCPAPEFPEFAFIGRSNVGKSSLINAITGRKSLAKTSQTPGKTQLINHFLIDESWFLTDLPGYGYAKVSKSMRGGFQEMILTYLSKRENLACLFTLIDIRIPPQKIDLEFLEFCGEEGVPFEIVFTKIDKLKHLSKAQTAAEQYTQKLLESWEELPNIYLSSAETQAGCAEILSRIREIKESMGHAG